MGIVNINVKARLHLSKTTNYQVSALVIVVETVHGNSSSFTKGNYHTM